MDVCPICKSGEVFIGNAMEFGMVVDCYAPCACPDPTDADYSEAYPGHGWYSVVGSDFFDAPEWAEDHGCGPINFAALAETDRQMEREREAALSQLGEPTEPDRYDLPAALLA
jgi:hypothetical protein